MSAAGFVWGMVCIFVVMVVAMLVAPVGMVVMGGIGMAALWCVLGWALMRRGTGRAARGDTGEEAADEVCLP